MNDKYKDLEMICDCGNITTINGLYCSGYHDPISNQPLPVCSQCAEELGTINHKLKIVSKNL